MSSAVVRINIDSVEQIADLPEIGSRRAQRIVEHRQVNGPILTAEVFAKVAGIGFPLAELLWDARIDATTSSEVPESTLTRAKRIVSAVCITLLVFGYLVWEI